MGILSFIYSLLKKAHVLMCFLKAQIQYNNSKFIFPSEHERCKTWFWRYCLQLRHTHRHMIRDIGAKMATWGACSSLSKIDRGCHCSAFIGGPQFGLGIEELFFVQSRINLGKLIWRHVASQELLLDINPHSVPASEKCLHKKGSSSEFFLFLNLSTCFNSEFF